MSGNIVEFPGHEAPAPIEAAPSGRDEKMAQAFRNLEPEICGCVRWPASPCSYS
jgi:hypothetical protein